MKKVTERGQIEGRGTLFQVAFNRKHFSFTVTLRKITVVGFHTFDKNTLATRRAEWVPVQHRPGDKVMIFKILLA